MNVAVFNLKKASRNFVKLIALSVFMFISIRIIVNNLMLLQTCLNFKRCSILCTDLFEVVNKKEHELNYISILEGFCPLLFSRDIQSPIEGKTHPEIAVQAENDEKTIIISKEATTETITDKNISDNYNMTYGNVKIRNQSKCELTEEVCNAKDLILKSTNKILIYHTHTCESYTPSERYNYSMTGNYRTTDNNYNMVRVGDELSKYLEEKGFEVIHNTSYHDYPSYNGSYDRSYTTAQNILNENPDVGLVIDLHRDAIGDGASYGPTVKVNGERVAQLMFVIGTDGGGLEHPNWVQNLKTAIKIQETGNLIYPGLFKPMMVRNSRYNQHIAMGASIIEVGATGNTLEECLLSMQCLANVIEEAFGT